jgi:hypothetical protein
LFTLRSQFFTIPLAIFTLIALVVSTGCAAWRDVTTGPRYREYRKPNPGGDPEFVYRIEYERAPDGSRVMQRDSIFNTVQSIPFKEDVSTRMRSRQESTLHTIGRVPGGIAHAVYGIVTFPLFLLAYGLALPVWFDTEREPVYDMKPRYWEEYPLYWITRGYWVTDFIFHDIPFVAVAYPVRLISGKPYEWEEELEGNIESD